MYNYNNNMLNSNKKKNPKRLALKLSNTASVIPAPELTSKKIIVNDNMQQLNDFYKQGPACILPNLYLGGYNNASNVSQLNELEINCIINVASEVNINTQLEYHHIHWTHTQNNLAKSEFSNAISKIESAFNKGHTILVHCQQGIERSAALIIAYVLYISRQKSSIINLQQNQRTIAIQGQNWSLDRALKYVQERAPGIRPNMELLYQLREYDKLTIASSLPSSVQKKHNIRNRTKRSESIAGCSSSSDNVPPISEKSCITTVQNQQKNQLRPRSASFKESSLSSITQQKQKKGDMALTLHHSYFTSRQKLATAVLLVVLTTAVLYEQRKIHLKLYQGEGINLHHHYSYLNSFLIKQVSIF